METYIDQDGIAHALVCLDDNTGNCSGDVELLPTYHLRYTRNGDVVRFPRCERHYDAYWKREEEREERAYAAERANYCKHGTFVGDPYGPDYLCGRCEDGS